MNSTPLMQQSALALPPHPELLPFEQDLIKLTQKDYIELKWQAAFWKTQHGRVIEREALLKEQLKQKDATISNLKQHL